jgi:hypothetical protein
MGDAVVKALAASEAPKPLKPAAASGGFGFDANFGIKQNKTSKINHLFRRFD